MIILPARLLWDKGVGEFVNVARKLPSGPRSDLLSGILIHTIPLQ